MAMVRPRATGEFVRLSTSQLRARSCIQVPARETNWPNQKSR